MYICVCFTLFCILLKGHRNSLAFFVSYPCCIFYEISWLWNRLFTVSKVLLSLASTHSHSYKLTSWCDFGVFLHAYFTTSNKVVRFGPVIYLRLTLILKHYFTENRRRIWFEWERIKKMTIFIKRYSENQWGLFPLSIWQTNIWMMNKINLACYGKICSCKEDVNDFTF